MTSNLMPNQRESLRIPKSDFAHRYVTYERRTVHDIDKAIGHLKSNVCGFFVLMPLNWGEGADVDGGVFKYKSIDIAQDNHQTLPREGGHT
ncbi:MULTISPECIES: hypothetical protein [unclassified Variovorax]|uniref:hypothetical protein n=1 Tax=unclassified Variovorax TaxID=663243 RepID=UPI001BD4C64A|nr:MULTISPECIES: hypothetical protein [unclassified Variovorax]